MPEERTLETGTGNVTLTVKVNGEPLPPEMKAYTCLVTHEFNRISKARISFSDGGASREDFPLSNSDLFIPGAAIEVLAGYDSETEPVFNGIITGQNIRMRKDGKPTLTIEARHEAVKMTLSRKSRYFYEMSDSDAITEILDNNNIGASVEDTGYAHEELVQFESTDWDFIISRAEANGLFCDTSGSDMKVYRPDFNGESILTLTYGATMLEFDANMDARTQQKKVTASVWNKTGQSLNEREGESTNGSEQGNLNAAELADSLDSENFNLFHGGSIKDEEAQAWANARTLRSKMARITGRVKFRGQSTIVPGKMISLKGVGERFSGDVLLTAVRHSIADGKWRTDAQFGLNPEWFTEKNPVSHTPAGGMLPAVNGLQTGLVTKLEGDPEEEGRILVRLPLIDPDGQGIWSRIATPGAGEERGFFFRPEIGDEVLVGFFSNDPRQAVILGGLHSSANPHPEELSDDNHRKGLVTRNKIKAIFDDEKGAAKIETPDGKVIYANDADGFLKLEDENGNKLVMDSNGITLDSQGDITIKCTGDIKCESTNIQNQANGKFEANGKGGAELSSNGSTTVKGSVVQIN